jgi:hypothetical protein
MDFKPNEFFIGVVEFITILLPGTLLMALLLAVEEEHQFISIRELCKNVNSADSKTVFWVAFFIASFGVGYYLSSFASGLDQFYDMVRKQIYPFDENLKVKFVNAFKRSKIEKTFKKKVKRLFFFRFILFKALMQFKRIETSTKDAKLFISNHSEKVPNYNFFKQNYMKNIFRKLMHFFFELEFELSIDKCSDEAKMIYNQQNEEVKNATNSYKWASTLLDANYPNISDQANKMMAASKFFRSLVVVALILFSLQCFNYTTIPKWFSILLGILSFREYIVQRRKSTQFTYRSIVILLKMPKEFLKIKKED